MSKGSSLAPSSVRIDVVAERLWVGEQAISLRPRTWSVLRHLADRPGALVTKDELLDAVWPGVVVSEGTLSKSIGELRAALGDDIDSPSFIETVPRRGFRWIGGADLVTHEIVESGSAASRARVATWSEATPQGVIGRAAELAELRECFDRAVSGARQVVFVVGEAGAGKSTIVDAFLSGLGESAREVAVADGLCIEASGLAEPYRPFFEAIDKLARRADVGDQVISVLRRYAPGWLSQLPGLVPVGEADAPAVAAPGGSMLRQLTSALEEISRVLPVVVVLEDVHWADLSTSDACNMLARRRDPARLMIVATMRPAELLLAAHPLVGIKGELTTRRLAREIALRPFTPDEVREYFLDRFPGIVLGAEVGPWVHYQTAGNALFVRIVADDWIARRFVVESAPGCWELQASSSELRESVPDSLRELVEWQLDRLEPSELAVVEAASVLPLDFEPSSIAIPAELDTEQVEEMCARLARRAHILRRCRDAGAGRAASSRFTFVHSLVRRILLDRLPRSRLRHLHRAAAEKLERAHPTGTDAVAVQLALHRSMAGDFQEALDCLRRAALVIRQLPAPREVVVIRERILDFVESHPELADNARERISATLELGLARYACRGVFDASSVELFEQLWNLTSSPEHVVERSIAGQSIVWGWIAAGRYRDALERATGLLVEAKELKIDFLILIAEMTVAALHFFVGEFDLCVRHCLSCLDFPATSASTFGYNSRALALCQLSSIARRRGLRRDAQRYLRAAEHESGADTLRHDASILPMIALIHFDQGNTVRAAELVAKSLASVDPSSEFLWIERARFLDGLLRSRSGQVQDGIARMRGSMARQLRDGFLIQRSQYCAHLAEELLRCGQPGTAECLDEAFAFMERSGERLVEPQLYRLRGRASLAATPADQQTAEVDFRHAIEAARRQRACWDELLATMALADLLHAQGRTAAARELLEVAYRPFERKGDQAEPAEDQPELVEEQPELAEEQPELAEARRLLVSLSPGQHE